MSQEEKDEIKGYQRKRCQQLVQCKKKALQNKWTLFLLNIKMSEKTLKFNNIRLNQRKKTLKFNNIRLNQREFHKSKQPIDLMSVNTENSNI